MKNTWISMFLIVVASGATAQDPGAVDADFGPNGTGFVIVPIANSSIAQALAIDALGRIFLAGTSFEGGGVSNFSVARFFSGGIIDTSFGPNNTGIVSFNSSGGLSADVAHAVVLDNQGRILLGGFSDFGVFVNQFAIVRFFSSGLVDLDFGPNNTGFTVALFSGEAYAMVLDNEQRVLLGGDAFINVTTDFGLARFTSGGLVDTEFGNGNGFVTLDISGNDSSVDNARALILDKQDRILLGGSSEFSFTIARFSQNGILDTSFGPTKVGFVLLRLGDAFNQERANGMVVDSQGRIIIAGATNFNGTGGGSFDPTDFLLARFTPDGVIDPSFGPNKTGFVSLDFSGTGTSNDVANAIAIDSRGRFVVGGTTNVNGSNDFALARFSPDGLLDTSFGPGETGFAVLDFSGDNSSADLANALGLDSKGGILLGGQSNLIGGADQFALARFFGEEFNACALALREKYCFLP